MTTPTCICHLKNPIGAYDSSKGSVLSEAFSIETKCSLSSQNSEG